MAKQIVPKLLNLNAPTIRDQRTLIWLKDHDTSVNWSKWDGVVSSIADFNKWSALRANIIGAVITEVGRGDDFIDQLYAISKKVSLVLLSQAVLSLKSQEFWSENFDNVLSLDIILDQYPFVGQPWDGSVADGIAIFSILCRYNRLIDCPNGRRESNSGMRPNETWVFTQFFKHTNAARFKEIKECLIRNCACEHIDRIVLINEKDYTSEFADIPNAVKIQQVITGKRLTYADFLKYVHDDVPNGVHVALCNADIYFGDSLVDLHKINMSDRMLGLLRWDVDAKGDSKIFGPRADSQDTWIFLSDSIKARKWNYTTFNFQLGQAGCDNAFAGHILRQKILISNPAVSFKTFHLHNTNIRNYSKADYIRAEIYINLAPGYVIDSKQLDAPPGTPTVISNELVSFEVKSSSMSNEITYCTMLEKGGRYKWEPSVENHYFVPSIPVHKWTKSSVTPNGLVYDLFTIYKGKHADNEQYNYWSTANVDILTPQQHRERMFAIPFKNTDIFKHPDTYILNYVSRCARLLKLFPGTAFWIPRHFAEYLEYFDWGGEKLKAPAFDENTACYADEVIGFLPGPAAAELGQEDISALRSLYPSWVEKPCGKICAVVVGQQITQTFVEERVAGLLRGLDEEWSIRYVNEGDYASYDALLGASLCIFIGGQKSQKFWSKLWALPKECCVVEFQQELLIDGEFQHLAHIAGFKSWVLLLSKGPVNDVQDQVMEQLERWFKKNGDEIICGD
jgi:hypothetical protein